MTGAATPEPPVEGPRTRLGRLGDFFDKRLGLARLARAALDKIFPDQWSFLLGEIALYSFVILVGTGIFLALFFTAGQTTVTYDGSYAPLQGVEMSAAYQSALDLSFDVRAGLFFRQMHHWAALIFMAAIIVHMMRVFFTGAFRRPREINWVIGLSLFLLAFANGFAGYSLLDDQLSGTGLRIGNAAVISIPLVGTWIGSFLFGGDFPGDAIIGRLYSLHILVIPLLIAVLLAAHLTILIRHKHTHFPGKGARDDNVVGQRLWPTYTAKALGLFFITAGVLALMAGLLQINPIWLYGPFDIANVSSASQPDWYVGWLEGALRVMPNWTLSIFGYEIPNPFWGGVLLPGVTFSILYAWPWIEARLSGDRREHHVLDRPRDRPLRTALGVAVLVFYTVLGLAGADDVIAVAFGLSLNAWVWALRVGCIVLPIASAFITFRVCKELQLRDGPAPATGQRAPGGVTPAGDAGGDEAASSDPVPGPAVEPLERLDEAKTPVP
ncbi:MAG: Cytochrome bc1 complex cytochrome b subunit [Acidimicrobiales bacterium]|nr:MAG: cytochrome bc complex cytochrome b subunit [Actinomycetota bacterium]MBV6507401.1 Cytochrome bc1 complex cytochrome b subunit [Acidimicrobiales bacterium]RIK07788.1 MAG: cytochrome b [Acidobacteriota bacterium]